MAPRLEPDKPPGRKKRPLESVSRPKQARSERTLSRILDAARPSDALVLMSNGHFGDIYDRVIVELTKRSLQAS